VHKRLVLRAFRIERKTLWRLIQRGEVAATDAGLVCVDDVREWVRATRAARVLDMLDNRPHHWT
jgi:hypothetical protein